MFFATCLTYSSIAQVVGIRIGVNVYSLRIDESDLQLGFNSVTRKLENSIGVQIGGTIEFPLGKFLAIETGLKFDQKGYKITFVESNVSEENLNLFFLDLPLTVKGKLTAGPFSFYGKIGSYIGSGLVGYVAKTGLSGTKREGVDFVKGELERLDYGLLGGFGIGIKAIQFEFTYSHGIADAVNGATKHKMMGFSFGYLFGRK